MILETPHGTRYGILTGILNEPHIVIAGCTGSGKSVLLHDLIYRILQDLPTERILYLCDPKRVELARYQDVPHCAEFANNPRDIESLLAHVHSMMMCRFQDMESKRQRDYQGADIYVVIDEFADLIINSNGKQIERYIESIGKLGRAAHVHLILATQAPNRKTLKANIMLNMTGRIGLRCKDSIESKQIIGRSGCENLPRYGSFYFDSSIYGFMKVDDFPYYQDNDIDKIINHWERQNRGLTGRLFKWTRKWN